MFFIDPYIRFLFANVHNNVFDMIFYIGHWYGKLYLTIYTILILYLSGLFLKKDKIREIGWKILQSFLFSGIVVTILKSIFGRWRPYSGHDSVSFVFFTFGPNDHLSLPSGDVAVAFAFSTIVAGIFKEKLWKIFWFGIAVLTALGRIYHDQHWFTDVVLASFIAICIGNIINNSIYSKKD